jgi:hypothetical protein
MRSFTGQTFEEPGDIRVFHKPFDADAFLDQVGGMIAAAKRRGERRGRASARVCGSASDGSRRGAKPAPRIDLVLYVSAASENSRRALSSVRAVLARFKASQVKFSVCDLAVDPERATDDLVVFTPTLVKRAPGPRTWLVGNLEHDEALMDLLDGSGVDRREGRA